MKILLKNIYKAKEEVVDEKTKQIEKLQKELKEKDEYIEYLHSTLFAKKFGVFFRTKAQIKRVLNALYISPSYIGLIFKIIFKNSIGICATYFNEERLKDGYFRRIKAVDSLLEDKFKVYFSFGERASRPWIEYPDKNTAVFYYNELIRSNRYKRNFLIFILGRIYCHAVYQLEKEYFRIPFLKVYVDMHGSGPEEELLYKNYNMAQKFTDVEELSVKKAAHIFCVTNAMVKHLSNKYGEDVKTSFTVMPIYDKKLERFSEKPKDLPEGKVTLTYAGGCAKWQNIELMQEALYKLGDEVSCLMCVPRPEEFWAAWKYPDVPEGLIVESKTYDELCSDVYPKAQYGFVLRDDIVVNRVACPTKIAEYLENDIIPIVSTPGIGDFAEMGMVYITLEQLLNKEFLSAEQYKEGVLKNRELLVKFKEVHINGAKEFREILR